MKFGRLTDFVERGLLLQEARPVFFVISESETEDFIVFLNTEQQLFEGIDATGTKLEIIGGGYTAFTIILKRDKGQPTDRVTLKDTGALYESFRVKAQNDSFIIAADFVKDGEDLRARWGDNLAGLTDESRNKLVEFILPEIQVYLLNYLLQNG